MNAAVMNDQPSQPLTDPHAPSWEKTYSVWTHLTTLTMGFVPVIPALIMWQTKRTQSPFVDDHGKEVVNFQISLVIYSIAATILTFIFIGIILWFAIIIFAVIALIMGAVAAGNGRYFRYPATIRLIK